MNPTNNLSNRNYQFQRSEQSVTHTHHFVFDKELSFSEITIKAKELFNGIYPQSHSIGMNIRAAEVLLTGQRSLDKALAKLQPQESRIIVVVPASRMITERSPELPLQNPTDEQLFNWSNHHGLISRITGIHDRNLIELIKPILLHSEHMRKLRTVYKLSCDNYMSRIEAMNISPEIARNPERAPERAPETPPVNPRAHLARKAKLQPFRGVQK